MRVETSPSIIEFVLCDIWSNGLAMRAQTDRQTDKHAEPIILPLPLTQEVNIEQRMRLSEEFFFPPPLYILQAKK